MTLAALWALIQSKFVSFRTIILIILAVIVLGLAWYGYHSLTQSYYDKGVAAQKKTDDKVIAKLQEQLAQSTKDLAAAKGQTKDAQTTLAKYVDQYNQYVAQTKKDQAKLLADQKAELAKLNSKLGTLNKQLQNAQSELTNAISTYLPAGSSATCQLSRGLVQIYNASLTGTDSHGGFTDPFGVPVNAGAASGVSCSTFAGYLVDNGIAAYRNRELLISWQDWYTGNKKLIDDAIKAGEATKTPVAPTSVAPSSSNATPVPTTGNAPQSRSADSGQHDSYLSRMAA